MKSGRNQLEGIKEVSAPSVGKLQTTTINRPSRFPRRERCKFGQTDMRSRLDTAGHTPAALMNHSAAGELPRLGFFFFGDTSDARNVIHPPEILNDPPSNTHTFLKERRQLKELNPLQ